MGISGQRATRFSLLIVTVTPSISSYWLVALQFRARVLSFSLPLLLVYVILLLLLYRKKNTENKVA